MKQAKPFEMQLPNIDNIAGFTKLVKVNAEKGYLVSDAEAREWTFTGVRTKDGVLTLSGPPFGGSSLGEVITWPAERALTAIRTLTRALLVLFRNVKTPLEFTPESVYFLDDERILFLPPGIFKKIRGMVSEKQIRDYSLINNPYLMDFRQMASYTIGVLLYKILTGRFPYDGEEPDEIQAKIRLGKIMPPHLIRPELRDRISLELTDFFNNPAVTHISLSTWETMIDRWLAEGFTLARSREERELIKLRKQKFELQENKSLRRGLFWEKNGRTVLISAVAVVLSVGLVFLFLLNALKPRLTSGFTPRQVVESYYSCFNTLETQLMEDCLAEGVAKGEFRRVEMMFLQTRQWYAVTRTSDRIPADEWEKYGRPDIEPPLYIDGVTKLVISQEADEPYPVFISAYERWMFREDPDHPEKRGFSEFVYLKKDRLVLKTTGDDWQIYQIVNLETIPLQIPVE